MSASRTKAAVVDEILAGPPASEPIKSPWAWHHRVLMGLWDRLLHDRREQLAQVLEPMESHGMDIADSATDEFDHALALSQLSAEQDALAEIQGALKRIAEGAYGICEATGERIPSARLRAIPWTRFTKEVEEELEKKGMVERARLGSAHSLRGPAPGGLADTEEPGEEPPEQKANEEALLHVFSPPGRPRHGALRRKSRGASGVKGGNP